MNEQSILDALYNLADETEKLKQEIKNLTKINTELKAQVYELKERISTLE